MPGKLALKQSGSHRLACRALYRNLLLACGEFTSTATSNNLASNLRNLVQYRYRLDRKLQSPRQVQDALIFGREALKLLNDASSGSTDALGQLTRALSDCSGRLCSFARDNQDVLSRKNSQSKGSSKKQNFLQMAADSTTHIRNPNSIPIFDRPVKLPDIKSGKRFVPHYVVTQGIAFLRYGPQQPYGLSLFIRDQIIKEQKMWEYFKEMEHMAKMGTMEDQWDREIHQRHGANEDNVTSDGETSWGSVYTNAKEVVSQKLMERENKFFKTGEMLWNIKLKEEALAAEEKEALKQEKRRQRKAETASSEDGSSGCNSFLGE